MYYCCGITEKGVMPHNEDALLIGRHVMTAGMVEQNMKPPFVMAVSDGVSGENAGELASVMCLEGLRDIADYRKSQLHGSIMTIHEKLAEYSRNDEDSRNMQTTLCGIAVDENGRIASFNVGDSRLYRFRGGTLSQLSRDQSLVQLLYEEGTITHEERKTHVHRNIIFPVLGNIKDTPRIDVEEIEGGLEYGDVLLICSDGLSDTLSTIDIQEVMEYPKSLLDRLEILVNMALEKGCNDNISAAAVVMND
ncbi:MAG: serine/threonine-protein phosphatase [Ruminococcus sp.]|nr:serine/threonine-protein phosphatase [Ruminococcus sp.]